MGKLVLLIYLYRQPETESTAGIRKWAPQQEKEKLEEVEDVENAVEAYGHKNCRLSDLIISDYILIWWKHGLNSTQLYFTFVLNSNPTHILSFVHSGHEVHLSIKVPPHIHSNIVIIITTTTDKGDIHTATSFFLLRKWKVMGLLTTAT